MLSIVGQMTIGMLLALFFWRSFPLNATLCGAPRALAPVARRLVSVWQWMFAQDYGVINYLLLKLGLDRRQDPLAGRSDQRARRRHHHQHLDRHPLLDGRVPLAASRPCRSELLEAAELDGAGQIQRFFLIILPLLRPLTAIVFVLSVTYTVKVFDLIYRDDRRRSRGRDADARHLFSFKLSFKLIRLRPRRRSRQRPRRDLAVALPTSTSAPSDASSDDGRRAMRALRCSGIPTRDLTDRLSAASSSAIILFPLYWMTNVSLQPRAALLATELRFLPIPPLVDNYVRVLGEQAGAIGTSLFIATDDGHCLPAHRRAQPPTRWSSSACAG